MVLVVVGGGGFGGVVEGIEFIVEDVDEKQEVKVVEVVVVGVVGEVEGIEFIVEDVDEKQEVEVEEVVVVIRSSQPVTLPALGAADPLRVPRAKTNGEFGLLPRDAEIQI